MLASDPSAPVDLQAKVVDARPNGRFAQNNAMQRARDDVRRLGWSLCREPLIATVICSAIGQRKTELRFSMKVTIAIILASLSMFGPPQVAFSQPPISKGHWSYKNGKPESVAFDYGTELTTQDIDQLSRSVSIARITMGYAGIDCEYVTIEGELLKLDN